MLRSERTYPFPSDFSPRGLTALAAVLLAAVLLAAVLLAIPAPARAQAPEASEASGVGAVCGPDTPLSLLAFDTRSGRALFTLLTRDGRAALLELASGAEAAYLELEEEGAVHFAGSVGPGEPFALRRCGDGCVTAERWEAGRWIPMGGRLTVTEPANLYTTRDRDGRPWIVVHEPLEEPWFQAAAYYEEGGRWHSAGSHPVHSPASMGAAPAPGRGDGVVTGSGLFTAGGAPSTWLAGLPVLPEKRTGQAMPVDTDGVIYIDDDGHLFFSPDRGATWRRSRWAPWGATKTDIWTYGTDYSLDIPLGSVASPLPVAWFDHRRPGENRLYLSELRMDGEWTLRSELSTLLEGVPGGPLELFHLLHTDGGTWLLATDCAPDPSPSPSAQADAGARVYVREVALGGLLPPRAVPVRRRPPRPGASSGLP